MILTFGRGYLCGACKGRYKGKDAVYTYGNACICKKCASTFRTYADSGFFEAARDVDFLFGIFHYKDLYRDMFLDFKFNSQLAYGHILGMAMAERMKNIKEFSDYSYIVPVPVSVKRYNERGYNQSEILAAYISKALEIPMLTALKRIKHSVPQSTVESTARLGNVKDAFIANCEFSGENIILFDDLYTTGSTASECAKALKKAGAGSVCIIAGAYNQKVWIDRTIRRFI